jgi:hypothetical protein
MPRWQRAYVCGTCAVIGFALAYTLCDFGGWPKLHYLPYERAWTFASSIPERTSMNYVGTFLWGLGGGVVGAGVGAAVTMVWKRPLPRVAFGLLAAWSMTAFVLAGMYYTWNLWPF